MGGRTKRREKPACAAAEIGSATPPSCRQSRPTASTDPACDAGEIPSPQYPPALALPSLAIDTEALDAARRIVDALGEPAAREFLGVLKMPDDERLDLIAHLYQRDDAHGIAEMLTDVEEDPDDIVRLRLGSVD